MGIHHRLLFNFNNLTENFLHFSAKIHIILKNTVSIPLAKSFKLCTDLSLVYNRWFIVCFRARSCASNNWPTEFPQSSVIDSKSVIMRWNIRGLEFPCRNCNMPEIFDYRNVNQNAISPHIAHTEYSMAWLKQSILQQCFPNGTWYWENTWLWYISRQQKLFTLSLPILSHCMLLFWAYESILILILTFRLPPA